MNKKIKKSISTMVFTVLLTLVFTGAIAVVNTLTEAQIRVNKTLFLKRAVRKAAGLDPLPKEALNDWYAQAVTTNSPGVFLVDVEGGERLVKQQQGAGLWGTIHALVGFNSDRTAFTGFAVESHNETPGLGARMEEAWFSSQFAGKSGPFTTITEEPKDKVDGIAKGDHEMDAITGATVTTRAVQDLMNKSLEEVHGMKKGVGQ